MANASKNPRKLPQKFLKLRVHIKDVGKVKTVEKQENEASFKMFFLFLFQQSVVWMECVQCCWQAAAAAVGVGQDCQRSYVNEGF